jgi:hypothetical protein
MRYFACRAKRSAQRSYEWSKRYDPKNRTDRPKLHFNRHNYSDGRTRCRPILETDRDEGSTAVATRVPLHRRQIKEAGT